MNIERPIFMERRLMGAVPLKVRDHSSEISWADRQDKTGHCPHLSGASYPCNTT